MGILSKAKDLLFGKKDEGTPDRTYDLDSGLSRVINNTREYQNALAGSLNNERSRWENLDTGGLARSMAGQQENQLRESSRDNIRTAGDTIARKGLGNSSLGLRAILSANRDLSKGVNSIRANIPLQELMLNQTKLQGLNSIGGGLNAILGAPGAQNTVIPGIVGTGLRSGGLYNDMHNMAGSGLAAMTGNQGWSSFGRGQGQMGSNLMNNM